MSRRTFRDRRAHRGLTLVELVVAMAITAILLTVAVGGFGTVFARKRTEGLTSDLVSDLQYARSEAVSRNRLVRLTFGTNCYVIHTVGSTATSCNRANTPVASAGTGATVIKTVTQDAASDATLARQPTATPASYFEFSHVNGLATTDGGADPGALIGSSRGPWELRIRVGLTGRVDVCSPSSTMVGYAAC